MSDLHLQAPWVGRTPEEYEAISNPYHRRRYEEEDEEEPITYCDECGEALYKESDIHEDGNNNLCLGCYEKNHL